MSFLGDDLYQGRKQLVFIMKRSTTFIICIACVLVVIVIFLVWQRNEIVPGNPPNSATSTNDNTISLGVENFHVTGTLVRNNPGLKPDVWYIIYEQPGTPALSLELRFTDTSICLLSGMQTDCQTISVKNGRRAEVWGIKEENMLTATRLEIAAENTEPLSPGEISGEEGKG